MVDALSLTSRVALGGKNLKNLCFVAQDSEVTVKLMQLYTLLGRFNVLAGFWY